MSNKVSMLFKTMEMGYTPVGCLVRVKAGDTALELILKLKIDFHEKIISVHKLEKL